MARFIISKARNNLKLNLNLNLNHLNLKPFPLVTVPNRHRSSQPTKPKLVHVDLDGEYEVTLKLFDDLIQRILVKKATPDWLPFVPGSSFWVPPRASPSNVVDLVHKLTVSDQLSDEESLSVATLRGWPSSNFFIKGNESAQGGDSGLEINIPEGMEGTVKVKVLTFSDNLAHSEDEEG
ncbi:uncharacterized protein LOC133305746 [Gastrolobium bilobum]|uniref:uncharacterized protein LOC133305746 n=1 Tax=Gastrolobium bilobum TaxID=150636 RepID=UPI002AB2B7F8|nr:uncharacterized protein LOC133305746 [Gastrolobium bilobum]XP_061361972.1 uncharacterized protein LOC133305746 [Gastrolobium bilobum]